MTSGTSPRRLLHVAALPFPSHQGTQAALAAMLEASQRSGCSAALFAYPEAGFAAQTAYPLWRSGRMPLGASLRSGPSLGKLLLDGRMLVELQQLVRRTRPDVLIAHHVEAALLAQFVPNVPCVFFAHTNLALELPSYAPRVFAPLLRAAGAGLDRWLVRRCSAVAAISPWLALQLGEACPERVAPGYVPTPWPLPAAIEAGERAAARQLLGLAADSCVALYAGNLDAYQGVETLLCALARLGEAGRPVTLLLATRSDPSGFLRRAARARVQVVCIALEHEAQRRVLHAAADFALIVRALPGGLPIKLLDALARGLACVIQPHAAAGLPLAAVTACARDQSAEALAQAAWRLVGDPPLRAQLAAAGRAYVAREHDDRSFGTALAGAASAALLAQPSRA